MRESQRLRGVAIVVLFAAAAVRGQCVPAVHALSQPGAFPSYAAGPIATDGLTIAMAKTDASTTTPAIVFATFDANLNQLTPDRQIVSSSANGAVALLYEQRTTSETPLQLGLFYQRTDAQLILQPLDFAGNAVGPPIPVPHSWSFNDEFDVAWDAPMHAFAIAHYVANARDVGLWLTLVSPTGSVVSDVSVSPFAGTPAQPHLTVLPDGSVAVVWFRSSPSSFTAVTIVKGNSLSAVGISTADVTEPRIATDGESILVIFSAPKTGGGTELRYVTLDLAGNITTPDSPLMSGSGVDIAPRSLVWNPALSEWALVYVDASIGLNVFPGDIRLRRFASIGGTASDTLLSPDPLHSRIPPASPVVFLDNAYIGSIAQILSPAVGSESYLVRDCPFVAIPSVDHSLQRPFVPVTFTATGSGGTPGYTWQWQFGDNDSGTGAVVQHIYTAVGTYTVTLTGHDAAGATSVAKTTVTITNAIRGRAARH